MARRKAGRLGEAQEILSRFIPALTHFGPVWFISNFGMKLGMKLEKNILYKYVFFCPSGLRKC
jgi:hypothetical protein